MYVWDLRHVQRPLHQLQGHSEYIKGFEVVGDKLYSCSFDGTLKAWSLSSFVSADKASALFLLLNPFGGLAGVFGHHPHAIGHPHSHASGRTPHGMAGMTQGFSVLCSLGPVGRLSLSTPIAVSSAVPYCSLITLDSRPLR